MQHQTRKRENVQTHERLRQPFVVSNQPPTSRRPGEATLYGPAPRQEDEAALRFWQLYDLQIDAVGLGRFGRDIAGVSLVDERDLDGSAAASVSASPMSTAPRA